MLECTAVLVPSPLSIEVAPGVEHSTPAGAQPTQATAPAPVSQEKTPQEKTSEETFTRAPDPAKTAVSQNTTPARLVLPPPVQTPKPLPKLTAAQTLELENLAKVRWSGVLHALSCNDPNTAVLRRDLHNCAQDMLTVQNTGKLHTVLSIMMKLALRCERTDDRTTAVDIYQEVLSYVPVNAPHDAQRIRGVCLQRMGNLQGGSAGLAQLNESLTLLRDPQDRGNSFLFLGKGQSGTPTLAMQAFEQAFKAFQAAGDVPNQAKSIVHWAGVAPGLEPDQRIAQRLGAAVQLLSEINEPVYEANAYLELGRALQRIGNATEAWAAYMKALNIARTGQQPMAKACEDALSALALTRFWLA